MTLAIDVARDWDGLLPRWGRLMLFAAVVAAHALAFVSIRTGVEEIPLPTIPIDFTPLPEPAPPPAAEEPPPPPDVSPPPEPETPPIADDEPPPPRADPPPPPPVEDPVTPPPLDPTPAPPPKIEQKPAPRPPKPKIARRPRPAPTRAAMPRAVSTRPNTPSAAPGPATSEAAAASSANYAATVAAELNRHRFYPEAARAAGLSGAVGVAFTIGPSGHATSIGITHSSGVAALDSAARQSVASIHVPAPPGGIFRTATTIRFTLR
jgi:periplasmic protein TonB